jgi:hypothetical protein
MVCWGLEMQQEEQQGTCGGASCSTWVTVAVAACWLFIDGAEGYLAFLEWIDATSWLYAFPVERADHVL